MVKANQDIRKAIADAGVRQWMIADALDMSEQKLCKKLRYELPLAEKRKVLAAIREIRQQ